MTKQFTLGAVVSRGTQVLRMAKTRIESPIFQPSAFLFNRYLNIHCIVQLICCSEFSKFDSKFIQGNYLVIPGTSSGYGLITP